MMCVFMVMKEHVNNSERLTAVSLIVPGRQ